MYREPLPEKYLILALDREVEDIADYVLSARDQIKTEICRNLYDWWIAQADPDLHGTPWSSFDIVDHHSVMAHLYLVAVHGRGASFEYTLHGEFPKRLFLGRCWIKQHLTAAGDHPIKTRLYHYYLASMADRQPRLSYGHVYSDGGQVKEFESIDLPLVNADGDVIRFIGAIDLTDDLAPGASGG